MVACDAEPYTAHPFPFPSGDAIRSITTAKALPAKRASSERRNNTFTAPKHATRRCSRPVFTTDAGTCTFHGEA